MTQPFRGVVNSRNIRPSVTAMWNGRIGRFPAPEGEQWVAVVVADGHLLLPALS